MTDVSDNRQDGVQFSPRTAVMVVHGMGNQRPLTTVKAIAAALYRDAPDRAGDAPRQWWVKIDRQGGDIDLPVLVTAPINSGGSQRIVEFHECYWAPLTADAQFATVPLWLFELVRKGPTTMLPDRRPLWYLASALLCFWILCASVLALSAMVAVVGLTPSPLFCVLLPWGGAGLLCFACMGWRGLVAFSLLFAALAGGWLALSEMVAWTPVFPMALAMPISRLVAIIGLLLFFAVNAFFLLTVVGDAARYLRGAPENIAARRQVRAMGVEALRRLHKARWENKPRYDRIIIVAHSLGSVVAYDMLRAYWAHVASSLGDPLTLADGPAQNDSHDDLPISGGRLPEWPERQDWNRRARDLVRQLDARNRNKAGAWKADFAKRWIVTDLVTLGSPLSQAVLLLTEDSSGEQAQAALAEKRAVRDFPVSPALKQGEDGTLAFTPKGSDPIFHHGALFGLTRWTNLYFPVQRLFWGDIVGGAVAPHFGRGVHDIAVKGAGRTSWASHTYYWTSRKNAQSVPDYLARLREAVQLWEDAPVQSGSAASDT